MADESASDPQQSLEVAVEDWDPLLKRIGLDDIYLRAPYLRLAATIETGQPVLLHLEREGGHVVCPLLVRHIPNSGLRDAITPYGYGGPVATGIEPPVRAFDAAWAAWCSEREVVTTFVRFHPLYANHELEQPAGMRVQALAGTVGWRLDTGDLLNHMHSKHRNAVRKAEREGVRVSVDEGPGTLQSFIPMYRSTMRRVGARASYCFSAEHWELMRSELGRELVFANAWQAGELVASALCLRAGPWIHYHLSASTESGRSLGATTAALYAIACWAQAAGCTRLHLGGGVGGQDDSLLAFKRRFDPEAGLLEAYVGSLVHDAARYDELTRNREIGEYFPAYRDVERLK